MEIDPARMRELLVRLPDVNVVGVDELVPGWMVAVVAVREGRPSCAGCGAAAWMKDRREVDLVDLPAFDQRVVQRVIRTRWRCPVFGCGIGSWTVEHLAVASAGHRLTTRAARWATEWVVRWGRSNSEVTDAWHAKEAVRFFYDVPNAHTADRYLTALAGDLQDNEFPPEVRSLGRALNRRQTQIEKWQHT